MLFSKSCSAGAPEKTGSSVAGLTNDVAIHKKEPMAEHFCVTSLGVGLGLGSGLGN